MNPKYYNVCHVREYEKNGETHKSWTKIGVAFPSKTGDGFSVELEYMPVGPGPVRFQLFPPKPNEER